MDLKANNLEKQKEYKVFRAWDSTEEESKNKYLCIEAKNGRKLFAFVGIGKDHPLYGQEFYDKGDKLSIGFLKDEKWFDKYINKDNSFFKEWIDGWFFTWEQPKNCRYMVAWTLVNILEQNIKIK